VVAHHRKVGTRSSVLWQRVLLRQRAQAVCARRASPEPNERSSQAFAVHYQYDQISSTRQPRFGNLLPLFQRLGAVRRARRAGHQQQHAQYCSGQNEEAVAILGYHYLELESQYLRCPGLTDRLGQRTTEASSTGEHIVSPCLRRLPLSICKHANVRNSDKNGMEHLTSMPAISSARSVF
jgi:hypothetical protein